MTNKRKMFGELASWRVASRLQLSDKMEKNLGQVGRHGKVGQVEALEMRARQLSVPPHLISNISHLTFLRPPKTLAASANLGLLGKKPVDRWPLGKNKALLRMSTT
jgi:hypothetical protein